MATHETPHAPRPSPPADAPAVSAASGRAPDVRLPGAQSDEPGRISAGPPAPAPAPIDISVRPTTVAARAAPARTQRIARRGYRQQPWRRLAGWALALVAVLAAVTFAGPNVADLYAAATAARTSWRYDRALAFYAQAERLDPDNPHPHCLTGEVLALQQRYVQAAAEFARCQRMGEAGPGVWLALGDADQAHGDAAGAEQAWLRSASAGGATARRRLALLYEAEGRFDRAGAQWRALGSQDGQARAHLGLLALRVGDDETARADFVAARNLPGFSGQDLVDQGFVVLAAQGASDAPGLTAVGVAFVRAGMLPFARLPLEQAIGQDPTYGPAHAYLAAAELAAGEQATASAEVAAARRLIPGDSFTLFEAAELEMAAGAWDAARDDLTLAIRADGQNPVLWAEQGRVWVYLRNYVAADLSYQRAAQLSNEPQFTEEYLSFFVDHRFGVGSGGRAFDAATSAAARWPDSSRVQSLAAQIYDLANQPVLAYTTYQRANRLDPSDPLPYFALGRVAFNGGDFDLAVTDLRTAVALRPDGPFAGQARQLLAPLAYYDV
jgi:tetratricopeptide (TPR) repeat protein